MISVSYADIDAAAPAESSSRVDALVEQHLTLARRIAAHLFANRHVAEHSFDDFHQYALVGLVEAAHRYDASSGVPFEAYAVARVRGAVLNGVRSLSEQQEQVTMRARLARERAESLRGHGDEQPLAPDTFESLVGRTIGLAIGYMLEDSSMYCDGEPAAPESGYERVELQQLAQRVQRCLALLPERLQRLLRGHYLQGELFETIATEFGVSKGRVSQMHRQAIEQLRQLCAEHGMRNIRL
jgi:RNA polymerase sigma factor for flagellar operon FliA